MGRKTFNLIGQKFGRLTIIENMGNHKNDSNRYWLVRCDCGNEKILPTVQMTRVTRPSLSCGCIKNEKFVERTIIRNKLLIGSLSPCWKPALTSEQRSKKRISPDYKEWRTDVFKRDNYTCQSCLDYSGILNAHHIENFSSSPDLRTELSNGISLCKTCHDDYHHIYSKYNNTRDQLNEFLTTDRLMELY